MDLPALIPSETPPPVLAARLGAAVLNRAPRVPTCHRCGTDATASWKRQATDAEREQHWAALEAHIREQPNLFDDSNASYTADRAQPVTKAVFGCDEHQVDDMVMTHAADCGGHGECGCGSDG